jgi:ABC-type phosphate transport system substrate-binding protein
VYKKFSGKLLVGLLVFALALLAPIGFLPAVAEASGRVTLNGNAIATRRVGNAALVGAEALATQLRNTAAARVTTTPGSLLVEHGSRSLLVSAGSNRGFLTTGIGTNAPRSESFVLSAVPRTIGGRELFVPFNDVVRRLGGTFTAARTASLTSSAPATAFNFTLAGNKRFVAAAVYHNVRMIGRGATFPNALYGGEAGRHHNVVGTWFREFYRSSANLSGTGAVTAIGNHERVAYNVYGTGGGTVDAERVFGFGVGSGVGVDAVRARLADMGGTDIITEIPAADLTNYALVPTVTGGVAVIFNVLDTDGNRITSLNLTPEIIADIYTGDISQWDDARIRALNPRVKLPARDIRVAYRTDSSGTTEIFTSYLAAAAGAAWNVPTGVPRNTTRMTDVTGGVYGGLDAAAPAPEWTRAGLIPAARRIDVQANLTPATNRARDGGTRLRERVQAVPDSIGYASYGDALDGGALRPNLAVARVRNRSGFFVLPLTRHVFAAGLGHTNLQAHPVNSANPGAYPITGFTWLMVERDASVAKGDFTALGNGSTVTGARGALTDAALDTQRQRSAVVRDFIRWAVVEGFGDARATAQNYAPLTPDVKARVAEMLNTIR